MLLFFKFIHSIKLRATWLRISGDMTMYFGRYDSGSGRYDFGRDNFRATWPVTKIPTDPSGTMPPSLVTNPPGNRTGNWLVTRSFTAFNPRWHPWLEEIQISPPSGLRNNQKSPPSAGFLCQIPCLRSAFRLQINIRDLKIHRFHVQLWVN